MASRSNRSARTAKPRKPRWDGHRLWWGEEIAREYRRQAPGQTAVLNLFQRLGWPRRIDLHELLAGILHKNHWALYTAKNLNHGPKMLRFHAAGTKHGMRWECVG